ncbi:hypothetical protein A4A49_55986, partial [Nicotiana attenuata]
LNFIFYTSSKTKIPIRRKPHRFQLLLKEEAAFYHGWILTKKQQPSAAGFNFCHLHRW